MLRAIDSNMNLSLVRFERPFDIHFCLFHLLNLFCSLESIANKKNPYVQRSSGHEFSVAHYTGKVTYDVRDMADKNRDFLPPEMVMNSSQKPILVRFEQLAEKENEADLQLPLVMQMFCVYFSGGDFASIKERNH